MHYLKKLVTEVLVPLLFSFIVLFMFIAVPAGSNSETIRVDEPEWIENENEEEQENRQESDY